MGPPCPTSMTRLLVATSSVELADRWILISLHGSYHRTTVGPQSAKIRWPDAVCEKRYVSTHHLFLSQTSLNVCGFSLSLPICQPHPSALVLSLWPRCVCSTTAFLHSPCRIHFSYLPDILFAWKLRLDSFNQCYCASLDVRIFIVNTFWTTFYKRKCVNKRLQKCVIKGANLTRMFRVSLVLLQMEGLSQYCSNSIANALELLQSCTKPSINVQDRLPVSHWQLGHSHQHEPCDVHPAPWLSGNTSFVIRDIDWTTYSVGKVTPIWLLLASF